MKMQNIQAIKQYLHEKSNGEAAVLTLNKGLIIYSIALSNHPVNNELFGDLMNSALPYIKEESISDANISLEGYTKGNAYTPQTYEDLINRFVMIRHICTDTINLLYLPDYNLAIPDYSSNLGLDGFIVKDSELGYSISIHDNNKYTEYPINHLTLEQYNELSGISSTQLIMNEEYLLSQYIQDKIPLIEF